MTDTATDTPAEVDPTPAPTADDVRALIQSQRPILVVVAGLVVLAAALSLGALLSSTGSRNASEDSNSSTRVQLANNGRNGCITDRRNEQADALGRLTIAANNAEAAGLLDGDEVEVRAQRALFDQAVIDWMAATESLSPEVLKRPPPEGCGPLIDSLDDLPDP